MWSLSFWRCYWQFQLPSEKLLPSLHPHPEQQQQQKQEWNLMRGKAYSQELQGGPTGLVGGVIGRSLGSMNEVNDVVDDVLLFEGVLSVDGVYNETQELLQDDDTREQTALSNVGVSEVQVKQHVA